MKQLPFSIPTKLSPGLRLIFDYWQNLRRRENSMPFWDDVKLSSLPELSDRMMLVALLCERDVDAWATTRWIWAASLAVMGKRPDRDDSWRRRRFGDVINDAVC